MKRDEFKKMTVRQLHEEAAGYGLDDRYFRSQGLNPDEEVEAVFKPREPDGPKGMFLRVFGIDVEYKLLKKAWEYPMIGSRMVGALVVGDGKEGTLQVTFSFHPVVLPSFIAMTGLTNIMGYIPEEDDHFFFKAPLLIEDKSGDKSAFIFMHQGPKYGVLKVRYSGHLDFDEFVLPMAVGQVLKELERKMV